MIIRRKAIHLIHKLGDFLEFWEDIINDLKDSPYNALFLYKLYTKGIDFKLPYFINRVKEVNYLREKRLIEFISGDTKHQHYKPTKFTEKGLEIYKELEKEGFFTIFEDIPLNSKDAFKSKYYQKLDKLKDKILSIISVLC